MTFDPYFFTYKQMNRILLIQTIGIVNAQSLTCDVVKGLKTHLEKSRHKIWECKNSYK